MYVYILYTQHTMWSHTIIKVSRPYVDCCQSNN